MSTDELELSPGDTTPPVVRRVGDWHLVEAHGYQVSVAPDGLVMLPRHVHPRDVADLCAALVVAGAVAQGVWDGNVQGARDDERGLAQRGALVGSGVPAGSVRMQVAQRQSEQATIGRPLRRGRGTRSAEPEGSKAVPVSVRQQRRQARGEVPSD